MKSPSAASRGLLALLGFGLLSASAQALAQHRLDSTASPRQQVAALQVLDERGQPLASNPFARHAHANFGRIEFRLATAEFVGRRARIDLILPAHVPGLRQASGLTYHWRGIDGSRSGQAMPGQRQPIWTGQIDQAFTTLSAEVGMRLDLSAMGPVPGGQIGVEPVFELELLP
jgi:hypothetical protein